MNYKDTLYLIVQPQGAKRLHFRMTKTLPSLSPRERAIKVSLEIPEMLFKTPQLEASITVPEEKIPSRIITAEVLDNIHEIIQQQIGVDLKISLVEKKEE